MPTSSHYDFIDVTRAVAAFIVVLSHAQQIIIDRPLTPGVLHRALSMVTTQGQNAVVIFFVISGFWIIRSVVRSGNRFSYKEYMIARGSRLWIVLIPALLIGGVLDAIGTTFLSSPLYEGTQGSVALSYVVEDRLTMFGLLGNLLFLQDIFVRPFGSNGALWTLACEFWYYVYFPLAYLALRSKRWHLLCIAALPMLWMPGGHLFGCWLLGGLVFYLAEMRFNSLSVHWAAPVIVLALLGAVISLSKLFVFSSTANDIVVASTFSLFMFLGLRSSFGSAKGLGWVARFGAHSSYSLYATHLPLLVFLSNFIAPTTRLPAHWTSWAIVALLAGVAVVFALPFSWLTEARTPILKRWASRVF